MRRWQANLEQGAAAVGVANRRLPAVGLGPRADDREAEPAAANRRAISLAAREALEDPLLLAGRDARPAVGDLEDGLVALALRRGHDRRAGRGV